MATIVVAVGLTVVTAGMASPLLAAAVVGAGAGFTSGAVGTWTQGGSFADGLVNGGVQGLIGAASGYAGAYMSTAIGAVGIVPGALSGAATSTTLGAMTNVISGNDWNTGLGMAAVLGGIGGGISGFSAAKASGSNIWFGTEVKPSATVVAGNINNETKAARLEYDKLLKSQTEPTSLGNTATNDLSPTHYITKSKTQMTNLVDDIKANGITDPIAIVKENGLNYIVDGHHRYFSAKILGIDNVPTIQVTLPYKGYQNSYSLILEGKQPGWWKYFNPNK